MIKSPLGGCGDTILFVVPGAQQHQLQAAVAHKCAPPPPRVQGGANALHVALLRGRRRAFDFLLDKVLDISGTHPELQPECDSLLRARTEVGWCAWSPTYVHCNCCWPLSWLSPMYPPCNV